MAVVFGLMKRFFKKYRETEDYSKMQGPLAAQEYIQELIRKKPLYMMNFFPKKSGSDPSNVSQILEPPPGMDINVWQYEHFRQFILELNLLVTQLKGECTPEKCPRMTSSEDLMFLCAAHKDNQEVPHPFPLHNLPLFLLSALQSTT